MLLFCCGPHSEWPSWAQTTAMLKGMLGSAEHAFASCLMTIPVLAVPSLILVVGAQTLLIPPIMSAPVSLSLFSPRIYEGARKEMDLYEEIMYVYRFKATVLSEQKGICILQRKQFMAITRQMETKKNISIFLFSFFFLEKGNNKVIRGSTYFFRRMGI